MKQSANKSSSEVIDNYPRRFQNDLEIMRQIDLNLVGQPIVWSHIFKTASEVISQAIGARILFRGVK